MARDCDRPAHRLAFRAICAAREHDGTLVEHVIHAEIVLKVAMIAIARQVIILDVKELPSSTLLGIAAIIITPAVAYYLVNRGIQGQKAAR